jgi:hypothetical protein
MLMYFFVRLIKLQIFDLSNQILFFLKGRILACYLKGLYFFLLWHNREEM